MTVVAACGAGGNTTSDSPIVGEVSSLGGRGEEGDLAAPTAEMGPAVDPVVDYDDAERTENRQLGHATPQGRKVIHRAELVLEAENTDALRRHIAGVVEDAGGYIEASEILAPDDRQDQPRITLTLRIPTDNLTGVLDAITNKAERVVSQTQSGQDVTEEYVDLEARIGNLEVLEAELVELLEDARESGNYKEPSQLLTIYNEISRVRGEIEALQGRLNVLGELTSLATVNVNIQPSPAVTPVVVDDGWSPAADLRAAASKLVENLQNLGSGLIHFAVGALPLLILYLVVPLAVGRYVWRRWRRQQPDGGAETVEAANGGSEEEAREAEDDVAA